MGLRLFRRFKIAPGHEDDFEAVWRTRESFLDGVPGFESVAWWGVVVPAGTPVISLLPPYRVKLRFYVTDTSDSGGSWYLVGNGWTETSVVWDTAPAPGATPVATVGAVTAGTWVEVDVTKAVTGNGTYSFMATSPSTNTAQFATRESTTPPTVVYVP